MFVAESDHESPLVVSRVGEKLLRLGPGQLPEVPDLALLRLLAIAVRRVEVEPGSGAQDLPLPHQRLHLPPDVETVLHQPELACFLTELRLDVMVLVEEEQRDVLFSKELLKIDYLCNNVEGTKVYKSKIFIEFS